MNNYQASGPGTGFLPRPALRFLEVTDPFLGTSVAGVPDGPFNRELYKLLENDSAIANLVMGLLTKTFGASNIAAPSVPGTPPGAPTTPATYAMHTVFFNNFEVLYQYDGTGGVWVERARMARVYTALQQNYKKVTVPLDDSEDNISVTLPTTNSLGAAYAFTLDDLKTFYINNLDEDAPLLSVLPGIIDDGAVIRVLASSAPLVGSDYELVMIFENISVL
jgi:hypothetical protein